MYVPTYLLTYVLTYLRTYLLAYLLTSLPTHTAGPLVTNIYFTETSHSAPSASNVLRLAVFPQNYGYRRIVPRSKRNESPFLV